MSANNENNIPLTYKGRPLLRKDNIIYYGSMADKYIIMLQILSSKKVNDLDVADKVSVQLQLTDSDISSKDRITKSTTAVHRPGSADEGPDSEKE